MFPAGKPYYIVPKSNRVLKTWQANAAIALADPQSALPITQSVEYLQTKSRAKQSHSIRSVSPLDFLNL